MGNGHAPGTEIGLGATGVETAATGVDAGGAGNAGLAVFFFAAFFTAGFLAGFFLVTLGLLGRAAGAFLAALAGLRLALATDFFFPARLALAAPFFFAAADFAFDFTAALPFFAAFFFAAPFFAAFFLTAIRTSVC